MYQHPKRWGLAFLLVLLLVLDQAFPPPPPQASLGGQGLLIVARDGSPLRAFPDSGHVWRHPVRAEEVSPLYLDALIAYEDRWFHYHPGVNPVSLARAFMQWLREGRIVSGGSTLSMQLVRILDPDLASTRTPLGKIRQILRALQMELRYSKRDILTLYLNHAPMGGVLEGVEAASRSYLGKPSARLSHAEAAMLAVLPQSPSLLRPDRHPQAARAARDKVLRRMAGRWSAQTIADALSEPPWSYVPRAPMRAPLFAERMRRQILAEATVKGRPAIAERVATTLDTSTQQAVESLLFDRARSLPPKVSLAALVVDNTTLEVLAYAGSADFSDEERFSHVDMVRAVRSPGSALKPFLYAFALDEGLIHSESLLADVPQSFDGYQPGNFQQSFNGPVSVSEALVRSLNVPAVEVLDRLDPQRFVALLRSGGLKLDFPEKTAPNLSVILGGAGLTLENLVGAYTALARKGVAGRPRMRPTDPFVERRMMSEGAAFIVRDILESGGPSSRAVADSLDRRRAIAWKTGTSFGFRDAWAVGVTDQHTIGVWVGRPDGTPNPGFFGANVAAPLMVDLFATFTAPLASRRPPPVTVTQRRICWPLGGPADEIKPALCHQQRTAWLLGATIPPTFADRLRDGAPVQHVQIESTGKAAGYRADARCAKSALIDLDYARWPAALEPWLDDATRRRAVAPDWSRACGERQATADRMSIIGVASGETLRRAGAAKDMPTVRLDVRGIRGEIIWLVNGNAVGRARSGEGIIHQFSAPGRYLITALDDHGRYDRVEVLVED